MSAFEDAKHGTTTGYRLGCRDACCRRAVAAQRAEQRRRYYLLRTDTLMVPATGTRRRIQALAALGWPTSEVSRRAGYERSHLGLLMRRESIRRTTAERIAAVYETLSMQLPPETTKTQRIDASRARRIARERGWPPPLAWDDDHIDDPAYEPHAWHYVPADRAEHLADLDERQAGISEVCSELGIRRDSVERWCERNGMRDMYVRFMERETPYVERRNQWSA